MFDILEKQIQQAFESHIAVRYGVPAQVVVEQPKQPEFGELAVPVAFQLAKQLRQAPKKIAQELVAEIGPIEGVAAMEVAGAGYINIRFDRVFYTSAVMHGYSVPLERETEKIVVEHTNINPNKAAHIGHLRNATLGDTFARMLRRLHKRVEVQNYIDNTGVQVADVVVGFHFLENKTAADVAALRKEPRFDYLCWDLYAKTSAYYGANPKALTWRGEALHAIESGEGEIAKLAHIVADAIMLAHVKTMYRLDVEYDVLPRESEILHLKFWAAAFELLKEKKAIYLETEGKNAGCWVMPAASFSTDAESEDNKVIVRSNGTVTYVGKDIAYQLWKFGLLGKDFYYKTLLRYPGGGMDLWITTDRESHHPNIPKFGHATTVYNVIDVRQSYLQDVVVAGLKALGYEAQAAQSIHFSYEMVALSPRCCADLGIELSDEDKARPYIEVAGRKGVGVKADDLIDKLIERALEEVVSRHADRPAEEQREAATHIAIGALRYFLLKFTRNSVIAFDFQEALSFEGDTGPYVQYAVVRANGILRNLEALGERWMDLSEMSRDAIARQVQIEDFWQMVLAVSKSTSAVERAVESGEPAHLAKYAFQLAQIFNNFYHQHHILSEEDLERRRFMMWLTHYFWHNLDDTLTTLGIRTPRYM